MQRTLINLKPDDKAWLDKQAKMRRVPMAELVRQAVHAYRVREEICGHSDWPQRVRETAGLWRGSDGLDYQQRLRDEWNDVR
jgi:hypothetical protein